MAQEMKTEEVQIKIKFRCKEQQYIENDGMIVTAIYRESYLLKNIFQAIETYLNKKYYPIVFSVGNAIAGKYTFIPQTDVDDDVIMLQSSEKDIPITTYDLNSIKQKGLYIELSWEYLIEVDNQKIDCSQMLKSKTTNPLRCDIYHKMLKGHEFDDGNLRHLENYIHFVDPHSQKPPCNYGDDCKTFIRMQQNEKDTVQDKCHMMLYRHPPRTRNIKLSKNLHSFVMKSNSKECHHVYIPEQQGDHSKELIAEVIRNGFRYDLCLECGKDDDCKHGYLCLECSLVNCDHTQFGILDIVKEKMNSKRYKLLNLDFELGDMLALVLYTGCDCNYDLCASQRNGDYDKWKWFDLFLDGAILSISLKEKYAFPLFSGLTSVQIEKQTVSAGFFATYVSTSSQEWVAKLFMKGKGMLIRFDEEFIDKQSLRCCDVSWISKFPDESEFLFARSTTSVDIFKLEAIDNVDGTQIVKLKDCDYDELGWEGGNLDDFFDLVLDQ